MINTLKHVLLLYAFYRLSDHLVLTAAVESHELPGSQGLELSLDAAEHHLDGVVAKEYRLGGTTAVLTLARRGHCRAHEVQALVLLFLFMKSMIMTYAVEESADTTELEDGTKIGGEPTGQFSRRGPWPQNRLLCSFSTADWPKSRRLQVSSPSSFSNLAASFRYSRCLFLCLAACERVT